MTRFFCIFSDFKENCLPASITIHTSSKRLAMGFVTSARQKTYFFREPILPRLVISGLIHQYRRYFFLPAHQK
ncbi:MAG: hypothetical protein KZQ66_17195 [Candidatus Thiodiazotropha sp. (ex Lucinoma aequizonata)]|nr:hypothetical protein [Candidatus Thiodiazotropha sp. (ex Lucinoma aequizonata)]MCU7899303.1 hypothetical protein [Candidatus Thiodiazotropha sp. (ex Lucinoma aequizonata)]MCU7903506.1 hypothetical protein [Candidatus Thiodiazotropha sp. (ex Lucinoma aequizonata)]MCU7907385.1 hypothetical protein [Candidatus Thiodiazotropha sp. (ex Lucinoma aequizonata)]